MNLKEIMMLFVILQRNVISFEQNKINVLIRHKVALRKFWELSLKRNQKTEIGGYSWLQSRL